MSEDKINQTESKGTPSQAHGVETGAEHNNAALGAGIIIVALFGLLRQLGHQSAFEWADAIIAAIGVSATVGYVLNKSTIAAIGALTIASGVIAYRHDLIEVNIKAFFFVALFLTGIGMVFKGMKNNSSS